MYEIMIFGKKKKKYETKANNVLTSQLNAN